MSDVIANIPGRDPILRIKTTPNDANRAGDIFGGWLMSSIDVAGAILAAIKTKGTVATVAVKELVFLKPLYVYDLVSFYADVVTVGTTSITIKVEVFAERFMQEDFIKVSDAILVFVAVSKPGVKRKIEL